MNTKQRHNLTRQRRERTQRDHQIPVDSVTHRLERLVDNQCHTDEIPLFDHSFIVHKVMKFHNSLMTLTSIVFIDPVI